MIEFHQLQDAFSEDFKKAMDIYIASFPPEERHPVETIRQRVGSGVYRFFTGSEAGDVVFTAWLYAVPHTDFLLFDYMAVREDCRCRGYGSAFLSYLKECVLKDSPFKYVIFEVEDPQKGDNRQERQRRYAFYRKNGLTLLQNVQYILPPLGGSEIGTDMVLLALTGGCDVMPGSSLVEAVTIIFREIYSRGADDEYLQEFKASVSENIQLV